MKEVFQRLLTRIGCRCQQPVALDLALQVESPAPIHIGFIAVVLQVASNQLRRASSLVFSHR